MLRGAFLILLVKIFLATAALASPQDSISKAPKRSIHTSLFRNLRELNLGYGFQIGSDKMLEFRAGYVYSNPALENLYVQAFTSTEMKFRGPAVYFSLQNWSIGRKGNHRYWSGTVGYRYLWFCAEKMWMGGFGGSSYSEELTLSQWRNELLVEISWGVVKRWGVAEFSVGPRIFHTHTHRIDTRFHPPATDYEQYKDSVFSDLKYSEGLGMMPVFRLVWKVGKFNW